MWKTRYAYGDESIKACQAAYHASIDHWCLQSIDCAHYKALQENQD